MVSRDVILIRINKLIEYMIFLDTIKEYTKEEYISNPMVFGSAERFLHLSIECAIDTANHIISDLRFRKPENIKDIFEVLYENKLLQGDLKENLCKMAQFRNILVHDYIKLDKEIVYDVVTNNTKDLKTFIDVISDYI